MVFHYHDDKFSSPTICCILHASVTMMNYLYNLDIGIPVSIYLFKVNNRNTRKMCEICSKLTIRTPERLQGRPFGVFIIKF